MTAVSGLRQTGIFYGDSKIRHEDIRDGSSNTILIGERSRAEVSNSTWVGIVEDAKYSEWRVVGWTGELPNRLKNTDGERLAPLAYPYAQFNSAHSGGVTMFALADGSVTAIDDEVDLDVFRSLGTINGREQESLAQIR